jgi:DNA-binding ferritin-like protein
MQKALNNDISILSSLYESMELPTERVLTEGKSEKSGLKDFAVGLLFKANEFHLWHLNCDKSADHLLLKEIYEKFTDIGDQIAEAIIGMTDEDIKTAHKEYKISKFNYVKAHVISTLETVKSECDGFLAKEKDEGIKNTLAGFAEDLNTFIYKLRRFQC